MAQIITNGFWLTLLNEYKNKILYQCATDSLTEQEFMDLWNTAGRVVWRDLAVTNESSLEYRVRAQKIVE